LDNFLKNSRRKFINAFATTATTSVLIPKNWAKPSVQSIVLPVHARASSQSVSVNCQAGSAPSSLGPGTGDASELTYYRVSIAGSSCSVELLSSEPTPPQACDFQVRLRRTGGNAIGEILFWNGGDWENNGNIVSTTVGTALVDTNFTDSDCANLRASILVSILADGSISSGPPVFQSN